MSELSKQIVADMKTAMKSKDQLALTTLRSLKAEIQKVTIDKYGADGELDDTETIAVVRKAIKQRQDSVESFEKANRQDLADKEKAEIEILEGYLPTPLSQEEIVKLVEDAIAEVGATSKKEMGQVMKLVQERAAGRAEGKVLSQEVGKRLS